MKFPSLLQPLPLVLITLVPAVRAEPPVIAGDVSPAAGDAFWGDPNDSAQDVLVGVNAPGSALIGAGNAVTSKTLFVSGAAGATGEVTVSGAGASWTVADGADIGSVANGVLRVENGATFNAGSLLSVDFGQRGGGGMIALDDGVVTTPSLDADALELSGVGAINLSNLYGVGYGFDVLDFDGSDTFSFLLTNGRADAITINVFANENFVLSSDAWFHNGVDVAISDGYIGTEPDKPAIVTLSGAGTKVAIAHNIRVGNASDGTLVIEDGAELDVTGTVYTHATGSLHGNGRIELDGGAIIGGVLRANATDFAGNGNARFSGFVGSGYDFVFDGSSIGAMTIDNGRGDNIRMELDGADMPFAQVPMRVVNGAQVTAQSLALSDAAAENNRVELDGVGTKLTVTNTASVGKSSAMRLSITNGAAMDAADVSIGQGASGSGLLVMDGASSALTVGGRVYVGEAGDGIARISGGAKIVCGIATLASKVGSSGVVEMSGAGTEWKCASMDLGFAEPAALTLRDGAAVTLDSDFVVGEKGDVRIFLSGDEMINARTNGGIGTGLFVDGTFQLIADRGLAAGTYSPLRSNGATTVYSGSAALDIFGMTRDDSTAVMLVPEIVADPGALTGVDLSGKRLSYDGGKLVALMHGFAGTGDLSVSPLGFANALAAYSLSSNVDRDAALRVFVGTDYDSEDLLIVRRADASSAWEQFAPSLLDFKDGYLTFRIDAYEQYAVIAPFDLASFRMAYGLAGDGSDDDQDRSQNGVPNLLYYAFGLGDPTVAAVDARRLPSLEEEPNGELVFAFTRPIGGDDELAFAIQTSVDLISWQDIGEASLDSQPVAETVTFLDDRYERVEQTFGSLNEEDRRFYRLRVSAASGN